MVSKPHMFNYKPAMGVINSKQRICPFVGNTAGMQISRHSIHGYFSHAPTCFQTFSSDLSLFYLLSPLYKFQGGALIIEMAQILGSEFPFSF